MARKLRGFFGDLAVYKDTKLNKLVFVAPDKQEFEFNHYLSATNFSLKPMEGKSGEKDETNKKVCAKGN